MERKYTDCLSDKDFDYIYCLPTFDYKPDEPCLGVLCISRRFAILRASFGGNALYN